jgi:hypothetical protein
VTKADAVSVGCAAIFVPDPVVNPNDAAVVQLVPSSLLTFT